MEDERKSTGGRMRVASRMVQMTPENRLDTVQLTVYMPRAAYEQIRDIAFHKRVRMHDVMLEGLDDAFRRHGRKTLAELIAESPSELAPVREPARARKSKGETMEPPITAEMEQRLRAMLLEEFARAAKGGKTKSAEPSLPLPPATPAKSPAKGRKGGKER